MKPSVSKLIDLLNKPALIKWANKQGLKGIDVGIYKESARQRGSSRHKAIEDFAAGVLCEDEDMNLRMTNFFSDKKIIDTEVSFETDYFTGRYSPEFTRRHALPGIQQCIAATIKHSRL